MEDYEIVELYHKRLERAITETSVKYGKLLHKIARDILKNYEDGEEMVNDTYSKAWDSMPPNRPDSLCAYVCRIVRNLSISRYRSMNAKKRSGTMVELSEMISDTNTVDSQISLQELTKAIESWLDSISQDDRILFMKRYFFADSISTLARETSSSDSQISGRLFRMRRSLRKYLEQEGFVL